MPRRWAYRTLLFAGLAALAVAPTALGQSSGTDYVVFRDPAKGGKVDTIPAEIRESPAGIDILIAGKKQRSIAPTDIVRVEYGGAPPTISSDLLLVKQLEEGVDPAKTRQTFADIGKKAGASAPEKFRRYLAFREAYWAAKVADSKTGDEFAAEAKPVADRLAAVANMSTKSWEGWPTTNLATRIQTELGDHAKAAELWGREARLPDLPVLLKVEARLGEATAMLRAGQSLEAKGAIADLETNKDVPTTGQARDWVTILKAAEQVPVPKPGAPAKLPADLVSKLTATIDRVKDPVAKAVGYNFLGDAHLAAGATREAMWAYLWADVVYAQSVNERLYALHRLVRVFEMTNDKDRAEQFREKLPDARAG